MTTLNYTVPVAGTDLNSVADPEISTALTSLKTWGNGNIDSTNITAALAQSAAVNQGSQTIKGAVNIATPQSTTSTTYTTLATPDQVTGITLANNGLIAVWYQAFWSTYVNLQGNAAIFLNSTQTQQAFDTAPAAVFVSGPNTTVGCPLFTTGNGLATTLSSGQYTGDVTTGQLIGDSQSGIPGGPCWIFAAAGTYTVSIQFKHPGGTIFAAGRKLWVQAFSFA